MERFDHGSRVDREADTDIEDTYIIISIIGTGSLY
jgi:hypothetical protein